MCQIVARKRNRGCFDLGSLEVGISNILRFSGEGSDRRDSPFIPHSCGFSGIFQASKILWNFWTMDPFPHTPLAIRPPCPTWLCRLDHFLHWVPPIFCLSPLLLVCSPNVSHVARVPKTIHEWSNSSTNSVKRLTPKQAVEWPQLHVSAIFESSGLHPLVNLQNMGLQETESSFIWHLIFAQRNSVEAAEQRLTEFGHVSTSIPTAYHRGSSHCITLSPWQQIVRK